MPHSPALVHEPMLIARQVRSRGATVAAMSLALVVLGAGAFVGAVPYRGYCRWAVPYRGYCR
jgi:hypothetical protein